MMGISTSPEQVAVWVNSFIVCAHLDIAMERMYDDLRISIKYPHLGKIGQRRVRRRRKEKKRSLDEVDWRKIAVELEKYMYIHPLDDQEPGLYIHICNGQVATDTVNVQNALPIRSEQNINFSDSLKSEFQKTIKKNVKTMELLKKAVTIKGKAVYDTKTRFSRLLIVGQQCHIDIAYVLYFEISPVSPMPIDEYVCLRKGNKAVVL